MTITRFSAVALASLLLLPAAAGAQQAEKAKGKGRNKVHKGDYSFRLTASGSSCATAPSGVAAGIRQDVARVGTFSVENDGTISGHSIATSDDGTTTIVIDFTWAGTFTVNDDGTGSISITTVNVTDASCTPAQ